MKISTFAMSLFALLAHLLPLQTLLSCQMQMQFQIVGLLRALHYFFNRGKMNKKVSNVLDFKFIKPPYKKRRKTIQINLS